MVWFYIYQVLYINEGTAVWQHKLGADRTEIFKAVEVDPENRNVSKGTIKEIEVGMCSFTTMILRDII